MKIRGGLVHSLKNYLGNILLIWLVILFYRYNGFYSGFLSSNTQSILFYLAFAYTLLGALFYAFFPVNFEHKTKGRLFFGVLKKFFTNFSDFVNAFASKSKKTSWKLEREEKTAMLFIIVKIFFLPLMLNFTINNYYAISSSLDSIFRIDGLNYDNLLNVVYPFLLTLVFFLDTFYFSIGYALEAGFLKNAVKSVEPSIFGWVVALACYPPFNGYIGKYVDWYADNMVGFSSSFATLTARTAIILLLLLYLWATLSLGFKCSNLTNRGIVSTGAYSIVRHPAYIGKVLSWWIMIIPVFSVYAFASMAMWTIIYFARAITEERHLMQDPDYAVYCRKVRYRFIPFVY